MPIAQYRMINGERWRMVWSYPHKDDAKKRKEEEKATRGRRACVIKIGGRYYVYVCVRRKK
jgi:hypothetical protein